MEAKTYSDEEMFDLLCDSNIEVKEHHEWNSGVCGSAPWRESWTEYELMISDDTVAISIHNDYIPTKVTGSWEYFDTLFDIVWVLVDVKKIDGGFECTYSAEWSLA